VKKDCFLLFLITLIGGYLRFKGLGDNPLWIDESLFAHWVRNGDFPKQEYIPILVGQLFEFRSEFWLRFQSALCGTLTIPAVYFVVREKKLALSLLIAVFPLFVFWSRMCRPYAIAGIFVVLGWRYWWFYIPAIITTPIAVIGVKITKKRLWLVGIAVVLALGFYFLRPDAGRNWTFGQILNSPRWFYVPILTSMLYFWDYILPNIGRPMVQKGSKFFRLA
jgi:hypothetical protein